MKELLSKFECDLATIESPDSCYALFRYTIEICAKAQLENELLRNSGAISRKNISSTQTVFRKPKNLL